MASSFLFLWNRCINNVCVSVSTYVSHTFSLTLFYLVYCLFCPNLAGLFCFYLILLLFRCLFFSLRRDIKNVDSDGRGGGEILR